MQTTSFGLGELLRRVKEKSLTIPQFQRSFTWRESQVKLLVDSISRSYPIGSLLLLAKKPNLPLASRSIEAIIREGYPPDELLDSTHNNNAEVFYILDGQQRTTSIARVFLNAHPKKTYYFDLKRMLNEYAAEETSWIVSRARGKSEPDRKDNNRLLRSDIILDQTKTDVYVTEYIEDSGDFPDYDKTEARKAAALIKGVFESVRNYQVPVVVLERDAGVESVCRVFETINSTGTRLTTFDLAVARFFPTPDLRGMWVDALDEYPLLRDFDVDGERVLQVLHLMRAGREKKYAEPTRTDLLSLAPKAIQDDWGLATSALASAYAWAKAQGARPDTLPNHSVLVALAAANGLHDQKADKPINADEAVVRRWYFCKVLQAGASQASNYRIGQDFAALRRFRLDLSPMAFDDVALNLETILRLRRNDARYKALQNLLATTMRQDLVSAKIIDTASRLHDHHLFPRASHKKLGLPSEMLDSVCNRIAVLEETNLKLNEAYPDKYFKDMRDVATSNGTLGELEQRLKDCLIPGNPRDQEWPKSFTKEGFDSFCRARGELILKRVQSVVGDSLKNIHPSQDELSGEDDV
ncbi:MAG: DUF262 domain-containing protein [Hyphomicrobiaceae bacterium]